MSTILRALRSPGAMREVVGVAPSLIHHREDEKTATVEVEDFSARAASTSSMPGYSCEAKSGILDRALDQVVHAAGSAPTFILTQLALLAWAFVGIPFHDRYIWPIVISDVQAILSYVYDSFLMRQQLNGYEEGLVVAAQLQSRSTSVRRMLHHIRERLEPRDMEAVAVVLQNEQAGEMRFPAENWFGKCVTWISSVVGHIWFVALYWACIVLWLGFGPANGWSNTWQLDINSATSALMMFIFSFIAFIRERHITYLRACLDATYRLDAALEAKLRLMSDDDIPNNEVVIPPAKVGGLQRAINYYADVIGTLVGIVLLIIVTVVWICIGPALNFNANWWLIIGTYAGLMGMNDGFVLRNVQARLLEHEEPQYARILSNDRQLLQDLNLPAPTMDAALLKTLEPTMSRRVSDKMNKICGHELMVILGVVVILGLIIGASAMGWSETGQLLCNVPPSVIETFFMIILITGHNSADAQRRLDLNQIFEVRRSLFAFAEAIDHVLCLKKREKESCGDAEGKEKEVIVV